MQEMATESTGSLRALFDRLCDPNGPSGSRRRALVRQLGAAVTKASPEELEDVSLDGPSSLILGAGAFKSPGPDHFPSLTSALDGFVQNGDTRDALLSMSTAVQVLPVGRDKGKDKEVVLEDADETDDEAAAFDPTAPDAVLSHDLICAVAPAFGSTLLRVMRRSKMPQIALTSYSNTLIVAFSRLQDAERVPSFYTSLATLRAIASTCRATVTEFGDASSDIRDRSRALFLVASGLLLAPLEPDDPRDGLAERYAIGRWPVLTKPLVDAMASKDAVNADEKARCTTAWTEIAEAAATLKLNASVLARLIASPQAIGNEIPILSPDGDNARFAVPAHLGSISLFSQLTAVDPGDPPRPLQLRDLHAFLIALQTSLEKPHRTSSSWALFLLLFSPLPGSASVVILTQLAQTLCRLSASSSTTPLRRFACQKALERLFYEETDDEEDKVTMLEALLADEDRPTRVMGCALLRQVLADRLNSTTPARSPFRGKGLLQSGVGEYLLETTAGWKAELVVDMEALGPEKVGAIEQAAPELSEVLNVLFFVLRRDANDQLGLRSDVRLATFDSSIVQPLVDFFDHTSPDEAGPVDSDDRLRRLVALQVTVQRYQEARAALGGAKDDEERAV